MSIGSSEETPEDSRTVLAPAAAPADRRRRPTRTATAAARTGRSSDETVFQAHAVSVNYGEKRAIENVTMDIDEQLGDRVHRAVRLRQEHVPALPEPDERLDHRLQARWRAALPRPRPVRPGGQPRRGPPPHRDGLPEAEPVPEVDLRQRRVGREEPRDEGRPRRARRAGAAQRGAVGRGQGPAQGERAGPLRRPAAASVHRARDRDRARRDPARRARLGA